MSFNNQHLAYTEINNEHTFTLSVPTLFSMTRTDRQDALDLFKEFNGHWNQSGRYWVFKKETQSQLFEALRFYNVVPTQRFSTPSKNDTYTSKPDKTKVSIIEPTKSIMVNVPKKIVAPKPNKVVVVDKADIIKDVLTLQKEFQRLHNKTGLCKTNMIKILRAAVPAVTYGK